MTVNTFAGRTYAVTSPNGCTVTTADGLTLAEIEAGKQGYFVAVSGKVLLSDEAAVLTQLFKLAPQQRLAILGVLGGGVPAWFKALETELTALLDGTQFEMVLTEQGSKLVVHTDRVDDDLLEQVRTTAEAYLPSGVELVQYNHNMEISWRDINKYAGFETIADLKAAYPDYKNDLTSDGGWIWPLTNMKYNNVNLGSSHDFAFMGLQSKYAIFRLDSMEKITDNWANGIKCEWVEVYAPKLVFSVRIVADTNYTQKVKGYFPLLKRGDYIFNYASKLQIVEATFPSLSSGLNAFINCQLNKESALRVLNSIPAYTSGSHPLTIGIHVDHKTDEEVLAAIANAEAKGWTLTVQWNGTPTAQAATTYGLRKPPIYAKVSEMERPDGTVERELNWGHYVTDPTGYEEFRSVEAAREYYGLPAEDLTNN